MGALDTLIKITFSTLIAKRFVDWDAFKLGLIDKGGNKIRDPKTKKEKASLGTMKNLVRKVKRTLVKFSPDTPTVNFLLAATLMRESHSFNELNSILTESEKHYFNIYLKGNNMKSFNEIINEATKSEYEEANFDFTEMKPSYFDKELLKGGSKFKIYNVKYVSEKNGQYKYYMEYYLKDEYNIIVVDMYVNTKNNKFLNIKWGINDKIFKNKKEADKYLETLKK